MQHVYRIKGEAVPQILKSSRASRKALTPYNLKKLDFQNQLEAQHGNQPLLTGAWEVDMWFLFEQCKHMPIMHTEPPSLSLLIRFIDEIAHGRIYANECIITDLRARKDYSAEYPEITLVFTRL